MTAQQHSLALPLRIKHTPHTSLVDILEANGRLICSCDDYDAPQIIRSVNAFSDLLAAARASKDFLDGVEACPLRTEIYRELQEAIRKAEL